MPDGSAIPRVAFNATLLSVDRDYRAAGIHRHIVGLVTALAARDDLALTVLAADPRAADVLPPGVVLRRAPGAVMKPLGRIPWEQLALPAWLLTAGMDLLHGPAYALPLATSLPAVVTIHDLSFFRVRHTLPAAKGFYLRAATRLAVRRARAIIAVSEFTRREILALLGVDPARVHVVPNGHGPACQPAARDGAAAFLAQRGLPERFILSVGTLEPRKNIGTLVEAYSRLRQLVANAPALVIAGAPGWGPDDLQHRVDALDLARHVHFAGFIAAADLPLLYSAATLFAFPSRYEGFGLPVIEAMACGTPVVASDAASLPEVAGDAALLVDPDDVTGWAEAMRALLEDASRAASLAGAGRARAARFSWTRAARETADVYRSVLRQGTSQAELLGVSRHGP